MPLDEVLTEEVSSLQQTLAVAEGPRQDMTVTCKQGEGTFVFTKGEQRFFEEKKMKQPAPCQECRKWIREKRAEIDSKNRFHNSLSWPKFKTAIVAWAMCVGWWTEARNADDRSGMQARGTKQRELVEGAPMDRIMIIGAEFSVSSGIWRHPRILQQTQSSRAHTNGKMGSRYLAGKKWKTKKSQFIIKLDAMEVAMVVGIVSEMEAANKCDR